MCYMSIILISLYTMYFLHARKQDSKCDHYVNLFLSHQIGISDVFYISHATYVPTHLKVKKYSRMPVAPRSLA